MTKNVTPELQILIADQALLDGLARAVFNRNESTKQLEGATYQFIAAYSQRVVEYATKADALLEVVRASGVAHRHADAVEKAAEGKGDFIFDYFCELRDELKN